jgi:hypothetical protein
MALNFGILQPIDIAGQIASGRQEAQRNQLAQQQLATGNLQQQHTQMQLEQATRERDALTKMTSPAEICVAISSASLISAHK